MGHGFSQQSNLAKVAEIGGLAAAPFAIPALFPALTGASAAGAAAAAPTAGGLSTFLLGAAPDVAGGFTDAGTALDAAQGPFGGASAGGLLSGFARPGGPLNGALNAYGKTQMAMNAMGMNQRPQMAAPVARPPSTGPAPIPSSQIFGQQQSGAPLGGSAGAVGNAMGMGGTPDLQTLLRLIQQRGMA